MLFLVVFTVICLAISVALDIKKTISGVKRGLNMFLNILPTVLNVLILVSVFLYFVPAEVLVRWLGRDSGWLGMATAAILGSIALIPGFIAYPLAAVLLKSGASYRVVAIFITTLLMVGVLTLPIEKKFFGLKVAIVRNVLSFFGAIIIGLTHHPSLRYSNIL